jgi:cytosine/adenosine deaminase-related metal-dependent hydrolase
MSKHSDKQAITALLEAGENYLLSLAFQIRTHAQKDKLVRDRERAELIDAVEKVIENSRKTP